VIPFEFRSELWWQKTRVKGLSCGVICVILRLAVLIQYRSVTDTHTHTDGHTTTAYTALSIGSRCKNDSQCFKPRLHGRSEGNILVLQLVSGLGILTSL